MLILHLGKKRRQKGRQTDKVSGKIDYLIPAALQELFVPPPQVCVHPSPQVCVHPSYSGKQGPLINQLTIIVVCCR